MVQLLYFGKCLNNREIDTIIKTQRYYLNETSNKGDTFLENLTNQCTFVPQMLVN